MSIHETELGKQMADLARAEGHKRAFPVTKPSMPESQLVRDLRKLITVDGLRHFEAARICGVTRSRVSQIVSQHGIKR